jgi:D-alanyl-D-alanine carboxypeptidase
METSNLEQLANRTRFMREGGIALLLGSLVLALFIFVPLGNPQEAPLATDTEEKTSPYESVSITAQAAIVYDLVTGEVFYEKHADAQLPLASLTKLLAVEAAVRTLSLDTPIMIRPQDTEVDSPSRFEAGDVLVLRDIARLTLTASLNDGASAIVGALAERQATSTHAALQAASAALGLSSTYAVNGNGLDVSGNVAGAYGSARDVAYLAGALVHDAPSIALATTESSASAATLGGKHYEILNTNPAVTHTPRLLLSKTGFTDLAGGNLALVFDASINHPIAVVILGSTETERFTDATALIAATLAHFAGVDSL